MTNTLLDLSGKIDPLTVSVLSLIHQVASKERIPFFIVGATARDILLETVHGISPKRATIDIDIAVFLENWAQFDRVKEALIQSHDFTPGREIQRFLYQGEFPVDLVPFGGIAEGNNHIEWPPDRNSRMSVAGFEECYRNSIPIKLADNPELVVQVVSLAGLAILKLVSWNDSVERRRKDAPDLFFIIENYIDAGNLDRFFEEAPDLVEADEYNYELTSPRLLGRDISKIASPSTLSLLIEILERESLREQGHRIAMDVLQSDGYKWLEYERVVAYFDTLLKGLTEEKDR
jgi:predicted nucleotidyltransferase